MINPMKENFIWRNGCTISRLVAAMLALALILTCTACSTGDSSESIPANNNTATTSGVTDNNPAAGEKTATGNQDANITVTLKPSLEFDNVYPFRDGLALVEKDDKYGFIDTSGNIIIALEYFDADSFNEGIAIVKKNGKYGCVDTTGNIAIPLEFNEISQLNDGFLKVKIDEPDYARAIRCQYGIVSSSGAIIAPVEYGEVGEFIDGLAYVDLKDEFAYNSVGGFIDTSGNIVVPTGEYEDCKPFSDGLAAVKKDGKWGFIDTSGNIAIPFIYNAAESFSEGLAAVATQDDEISWLYRWSFIDANGNTIIPPQYWMSTASIGFGREAPIFHEGLALVTKLYEGSAIHGSGFIDKDGNFAVTSSYDETEKYIGLQEYEIGFFSEGLAAVKKNGKWGFMDAKENIIVPLEYDEIEPFSDGLARIRKNFKYGFIDTNGNIIVQAEYDEAETFTNEFARVTKNGQTGIIDAKGNIVIPAEYEAISPINEGYVWFQKDSKWGLLDMNGNVLIQPEYENVTLFNEGYALFMQDGKWGILQNKNY